MAINPDLTDAIEETLDPDEEVVDTSDGAHASHEPYLPSRRLSLLQRLARGYAASPIAFSAALAVHGAVIAAGFYYLHVTNPPAIERPFGWAVDHDGQGTAGATAAPNSALAETALSQVTFRSPPASAEIDLTPRRPLGPPPGEFQPPDVKPPEFKLNESLGTAVPAPLTLGLSADPAPPVLAPRTPPGLKAGESQGEPTGGSASVSNADPSVGGSPQPAPSTPASVPPANDPTAERGNGAARAGEGNNDGGGVRGAQTDKLDLRSIPVYLPERGRKNGWSGTTTVYFTIDGRGRVRNFRIIASSGHPIYDQEVTDGVTERWRPPREFWNAEYKNQQFVFSIVDRN